VCFILPRQYSSARQQLKSGGFCVSLRQDNLAHEEFYKPASAVTEVFFEPNRVSTIYTSIPKRSRVMSTAATQETANSLPRINDPAPDFEAKSTQGPLKLSDYKGKWVILFSHPADFTPVCTTEFVEFARRSDEFKERGAQLVGLSVDSVPAHIAWVRNIEGHFGVKIDFPVIADLDTKVAQKYGLIHPSASETATVRAVFIIDPQQKVRALIYYPMSLGRNIDEVLRALDALQTADENACATPANWQKGDKVVVPPPQTIDDASKRMEPEFQSKNEVTDWYLSKRTL
jgi:peroxiredoxin (alkyl hydroperoxide reductase subunit C)